MSNRDMSQAEFDRACERLGFRKQVGPFGYYDVGGVSVSARNAGDRRRDQLAYLIQQSEKWAERQSARTQNWPPRISERDAKHGNHCHCNACEIDERAREDGDA